MSKPCENCQTLVKLNANQAKTIAELKDSVFQYGIENTKLQIQREELWAALKDIYSITNEMEDTSSNLVAGALAGQVMSIVMANLPEKTYECS